MSLIFGSQRILDYMISDLVKLPSVIGSVVEYNVANVVARVRFPDDALFKPTSTISTFVSEHTARESLLI